MTRDELYTAVDILWHGNQSAAARDLGISLRSLQAALTDPANGSYRVLNDGAAAEIRDLLAQFPGGIPQVDPRKTAAILHDMMQRAGWPADQSAGAILGAAWAIAVRELGEDGARLVIDGNDDQPMVDDAEPTD